MFYIVETEEQLNKIVSYGGNQRVFIDVIPIDDRIHPAINSPSLIYFRPLDAKRGFIICINHLESFSLDFDLVMRSVIDLVPQIYTIDKKRLLHYGFRNTGVNGLKMAYKLNSNYREFPGNCDTAAHKFYYNRLRNQSDVNRHIPISKHYEKYENFFDSLDIVDEDMQNLSYQYYNELVEPAFYDVERNGLKLNKELFDLKHPVYHDIFSIHDGKIYTEYDFFNLTARPSCKFNGLNFLALKKDDSRDIFIPKNDFLVELDYKSYQVKLLADHIGYQFENEDIHAHLQQIYGETDYEEGKRLTFRYLYGRTDNPPDIVFFKHVYELRDQLWKEYKRNGYILSPRVGRKITGITEITQILPYLMQAIETENNAYVIYQLNELLKDAKTKLVLYTYDAFLFDYADDETYLFNDIRTILKSTGCNISCKYGDSYGQLFQAHLAQSTPY